MSTEDRFAKRMIVTAAREAEQVAYAAAVSWAAILDEKFDHVEGKGAVESTFQWRGKRWRVMAHFTPPCGCRIVVALVKEASSRVVEWSSIGCPRKKHEGTWRVRLDRNGEASE